MLPPTAVRETRAHDHLPAPVHERNVSGLSAAFGTMKYGCRLGSCTTRPAPDPSLGDGVATASSPPLRCTQSATCARSTVASRVDSKIATVPGVCRSRPAGAPRSSRESPRHPRCEHTPRGSTAIGPSHALQRRELVPSSTSIATLYSANGLTILAECDAAGNASRAANGPATADSQFTVNGYDNAGSFGSQTSVLGREVDGTRTTRAHDCS